MIFEVFENVVSKKDFVDRVNIGWFQSISQICLSEFGCLCLKPLESTCFMFLLCLQEPGKSNARKIMTIRHVEQKRRNISGPHANPTNMCVISGFDMSIST